MKQAIVILSNEEIAFNKDFHCYSEKEIDKFLNDECEKVSIDDKDCNDSSSIINWLWKDNSTTKNFKYSNIFIRHKESYRHWFPNHENYEDFYVSEVLFDGVLHLKNVIKECYVKEDMVNEVNMHAMLSKEILVVRIPESHFEKAEVAEDAYPEECLRCKDFYFDMDSSKDYDVKGYDCFKGVTIPPTFEGKDIVKAFKKFPFIDIRFVKSKNFLDKHVVKILKDFVKQYNEVYGTGKIINIDTQIVNF